MHLPCNLKQRFCHYTTFLTTLSLCFYALIDVASTCSAFHLQFFHLFPTSQYRRRPDILATPVATRWWIIPSIISSVLQVAVGVTPSGVRGIFMRWEFPSSRLLSLASWSVPTGSSVTAGLALRIAGSHKRFHQGKVKVPLVSLISSIIP